MKLNALVITMIVVLAGGAGIILPVSAVPLTLINNVSPFDSPFGMITTNATVAHYSITELPVYYGILREGESVNKFYGEPRACQNVTTPEEAPEVARKALEPYGGLPLDAVSNGAFTQHERVYNSTLKEFVFGQPEATTISYHQEMINGLWTIGDSNYIRVDLGENGELLRVVKIWRNYTYTDDVPVIPINTALEKLRQGELINEPMVMGEDITIDMASPGYYAKKVDTSDAVLEPIWIMYGDTSSGSRLGFYVYARHFANFTPSSTNITTFETVQFTDTSETTPVQWSWDFGDGTNSTEQNPSHMYRTAGNYSVTLKAWNDMGTDTETKNITVSFTKPLNADFNATPLAASTGDTIRFYDNSDTSPNKWFWEFGDGTNSTLRNPTHAYSTGGNYTVNLTAWNANGSDKRTITDCIRIYLVYADIG